MSNSTSTQPAPVQPDAQGLATGSTMALSAENNAARISVSTEIKRRLDNLPSQITFAFVGQLEGAQSVLWKYGPSTHSALQILMDIRQSFYVDPSVHRELESDKDFFDAPASHYLPVHELTGAYANYADDCLIGLTEIEGLQFAVAWQVQGHAWCHLQLRTFDLVDAFNLYSRWMADTIGDDLAGE